MCPAKGAGCGTHTDRRAAAALGPVRGTARALVREGDWPEGGASARQQGSVRPSLQRSGNRTWGRSFGVLDPAHS